MCPFLHSQEWFYGLFTSIYVHFGLFYSRSCLEKSSARLSILDANTVKYTGSTCQTVYAQEELLVKSLGLPKIPTWTSPARIRQMLCYEAGWELRQSPCLGSVPCATTAETSWELWDHPGNYCLCVQGVLPGTYQLHHSCNCRTNLNFILIS